MAIVNKTTQLRLRRLIRRRQKQVEAAAEVAEKQFESNLINRFGRLVRVRRFVSSWIILAVLAVLCTAWQTASLSAYYQIQQPISGGIYNEGMVGTYTNANPIYATGSVDRAVSRLIFAGLLRYDSHNKLTGDLASSYSVDATGRRYTVKLKPNLTWQDGQPVTAADAVFTYKLIQNPDAGSPLLPSWQNIKVSAPNKYTITFDLPNAFAAFPYSLVSGILPEHLLKNVPASQMRADTFNTIKPVGAGPFAWQAIQTTTATDPTKSVTLISLKPFDKYDGGQPQLSSFVLHAYGSQDAMVQAFNHREIMAMAGLSDVPNGITDGKDGVNVMSFTSTAATMVFFKTSGGVLADAKVRQALVMGTDTQQIINQLGYPALPVREPLLLGQVGYNAKYQQPGYNVAAANAALDADGWVRGTDGIRTKAGSRLAFTLYAQDTSENQSTMRQLSRDWSALGVQLSPILQSPSDFQSTLAFHTYDALLNGIAIGVDPDVFPYWDSSQADIRSGSQLNFSEYKNPTADASLEAGRTRLDPQLRAIKYEPFLQAWQTDAPAVGLYQPRILYITRGTVYGLTDHTLNTDADRYNSVADWQIRTKKVTEN